MAGEVGVPDDGVDLGDPLVVGLAADAQGAAAAADVRLVHPGRLVGDDAVGEDLDSVDREAARIGVAGLAEGGEGAGELLSGARHSGGQEQDAEAGGQFAVGQQPAVDVEGLRTERATHDAVAAGAEPGFGVAGHAEPGERGEGRPDRVGPLLPAERRQRVLDEGLGPLVEQPGRLPGFVYDDGPAGRRDGVPVDPDELQRLGVDPGGVPGEGVQDDGVVRTHGVEVAPRGQPRRIEDALVEVTGVPAVPRDPLPARNPPDGLRTASATSAREETAGWPRSRESGGVAMPKAHPCRWESLIPGSSVAPRRSTTRVPGPTSGATSSRPPTALMVPPVTARAEATENSASTVTTDPPRNTRSAYVSTEVPFENRAHHGHPRTISRGLWPGPHPPHIGHSTDTRSRSGS